MPEAAATLAVRTASDPAGLAVGVRAALRAADPNLPPGQIRTMEQLVAESDSLSSRRSLMVLLGAFAVLAVLLAGVGVYGVISYSVAQRRQEIGLRMALGAQRGDVLRLVVRQALGLALAGVAIGAGLALALTRFLGSLVYQVSASDPLTFTAVGLLLLLVSLAASYLPAWAATRVDPMAALRVG
jgi:putative ABC transport system permease protein